MAENDGKTDLPPEEAKIDSSPEDGEEGKRVAFAGPAMLANRVFLTLTPVTGRLAFVEYPPADIPGPPQFRGAVVMNIGELIALKELLVRHLKSVKLIAGEDHDGSPH